MLPGDAASVHDYYDTAGVMYFSALRRTRAGRGQGAAGPSLPGEVSVFTLNQKI